MTEQSRDREIQMLQLPKNIRQMGKPGGIYRFYIEDYAYTYLNMFLKEHHQEDTLQAAVLLGKWEQKGENSYIFASGAAVCDFSVFYEDGEAQISEVIQKFFPDSAIVGWYVRCNGRDSHVQSVVKHYYAEKSNGRHPIFVYEDEYEGEMYVCVWEQGALQKLSGYYIYYEKNTRMQEYMICQKDQYRSSKRTVLEEPAIRPESNRLENIRKELQTQEEKKEEDKQPSSKNMSKVSGKARRTVYAACAAVLITAAATGISQMDNYRSLRQAVQTLSGSFVGDTSKQSGDSHKDYEGNNKKESVAVENKEESQEKQSVDETISVPQTSDKQKTDVATTGAQTPEEKTNNTTESNMETEEKQNTENSETSSENDTKQDTSSRYYTVRKGDSLFSISRSLYHTDDMVDELRRLNGLDNKDVIYEGQKLRLP